jgi:AcrR family transcriptional regulator
MSATGLVMRRFGRAGTTFASVGAETGLAPATLVQRYGSKDSLIQASMLWAWDQLDASTAMADELSPKDAHGAVVMLVALSGDQNDQEAFADGLLLLHEDMRDPVLRARGAKWGATLTSALGRRLSADASEQARLGRLMASQWQGAILWWGFSRDGLLADYVVGELRDWCARVLPR